MFEFLNVPFSFLMKGCLFISGNHYLLALLFFALAVQIILIPLTIKQQKSQIQMAKMRPKEMAIREKYKGRNDKVTQQKMNMEIQEMYQANNYNPLSGCLPLLIQLPIIFILFTIVRQPITYGARLNESFITDYSEKAVVFYQEEKETLLKNGVSKEDQIIVDIDKYIKYLGVDEKGKFDYSKKNKSENELVLSRFLIDGKENLEALKKQGLLKDDKLIVKYDKIVKEEDVKLLPKYRVGPINLVDMPSLKGNYWLLIIPLLVFLTSFFSTKLTRKFSGNPQSDANGNPMGGGFFMEVGMPIMSAIFTFSFSAAVGVYWIWRSLIGMIQTVIVAKAMPIPKVTEEEIAEARRELKGKTKKKKVITIEVDEDDDSYDNMIVKKSEKKNNENLVRSSSKIEMLTADEDVPQKHKETKEQAESDEN